MRTPLWLLAALLLGCGSSAPDPVGRVTGGPLTAGDENVVERAAVGETGTLLRPSESPIVTLRIVFDAGSAEDPRGQEGVTNLAARLMSEGGAGDLSYAQFTERLFPMAGEIYARVGRDETVFVGRVHRDHLEEFYAMFRDVLRRPKMEQSDFDRVLRQVQSELVLELRGNDDEEFGKEMLQAMLYEGHPYGHPTLGTETSLGALALEHARTHRSRVFCGGRATVGLAGGYPEGFAERVREDVASLGAETCLGRAQLPAVARVEQPRVWLVDKPEASAVAVSMGLPIAVTRDHADYPALMLAAAYLGQHRQFAGVLMQRMRGERGLNYGDYAYSEHFDQEGWSRFPSPNTSRRQQYFSIWIRPVRPEQAHFAIRMAIRELHRFVADGLDEENFERVRTFAQRYYALYLQTESRRLGFALDDRFYGVEQAYLDRLRGAWAALDVHEVNEAIRRHVDPAQLQVAVITPEASAFADRLASEEPSPIEYQAEVPEEVRREDEEIIPYRIGIPRTRMSVIPLADTFR